MLKKDLLERVLDKALSTGGDFAEIFVEDKYSGSVGIIDGKVEDALSGRSCGAGIRIYKGFNSVYAYTSILEEQSIMDTASKAAAAIEGTKNLNCTDIYESIPLNIHPVIYVPSSISGSKKVEKIKLAYNAAKSFSPDIKQVHVTYSDVEQTVQIANSDGLFTSDRRVRSRLYIRAVASDGKENQTGTESPGASKGFEIFETLDPEHYAVEAAKTAVVMLHAESCPSGRMPVAIDNGFGGVIFHEACGHSLEATAVAKGNSEFSGKLGQKIASSKVTAVDDGTIPSAWGSTNIDDEGLPAKKRILIENGILKSYMVDRLNARRMGCESTSSGRRQSYNYAPTSRMTNTYIDNGIDDNNTIISTMPQGLYAKKMGGGSVNPVTGEFNFAVSEGYLIKNGKIDKPVRGATLIGKGAEILQKIDMVGQNMTMAQGLCGSISGSIPTNVGQPLIRVSEITVGGK